MDHVVTVTVTPGGRVPGLGICERGSGEEVRARRGTGLWDGDRAAAGAVDSQR